MRFIELKLRKIKRKRERGATVQTQSRVLNKTQRKVHQTHKFHKRFLAKQKIENFNFNLFRLNSPAFA